MTITLSLPLCDERIMYEAIYRHCEHLAQQNWDDGDTYTPSVDSICAARMAVEMFPTLGYPVPHWITELAQ